MQTSLAIEAISNGAFDFIEKPFEADLLLDWCGALDPQLGNSRLNSRKRT
jgi:FixJ family two-component response regulator